MYTNIYEVRATAPSLLTTDVITDNMLQDKIDDAGSLINAKLSRLFIVPVVKVVLNTGTISGLFKQNNIVGIGTLFSSEVKTGDIIKIISSDQVFKVNNVNSDLQLISKTLLESSFTDSEFYIIPAPISLAQKYLACSMIVMEHFNEQANNQETAQKYSDKYSDYSNKYLKEYIDSRAYDSDLAPQVLSKTPARVVHISDDEQRTSINNFICKINSSSFT